MGKKLRVGESKRPRVVDSDTDSEVELRRTTPRTPKKLKVGSTIPRVFPGTFERAFWEGQPAVEVPSDELKTVRKNLGVIVRSSAVGSNGAPPPLNGCEGLPSWVEVMLAKKSWEATPVQKQAWPTVLNGSNILCTAPTGSGKTLGYVVPMKEHCTRNPRSNRSARALVLVPTRELAMQVAKVCKSVDLESVVICGGEDRDAQEDRVASGVDVIVATPGRLYDLVTRRTARLEYITYLVLDEADRMMALGFEDQLAGIRQHIRPDAQSMMFSATFPGQLRSVVEVWVPRAVLIKVAEKRASDVTPESNPEEAMDEARTLEVVSSVEQTVHLCAEHKKPRKLLRYITKIRQDEKDSGKRNDGRMLIFVNKIKTLKFVSETLKKNNVKRVGIIHGQLRQEDRNTNLAAFKAGKYTTLVCTDVIARGIHVENLEYVVNWDFPQNVEQYVHRVGRTGRQGAGGKAFTFFTRNRAPLAKELVGLLERGNQWVDPYLKELVLSTSNDDAEVTVEGETSAE